MDKKKPGKLPPEDTKGFEEFIESQGGESSFLPRPQGNAAKKETSFEHFTFLTTDGERLVKIKNLLSTQLPFTSKFEQGKALLTQQREEVRVLRSKIFEILDQGDSPYRRSLRETFDSYFDPPANT